MLKFMRKGHFSQERLKLQKELFKFDKTVPHGFPHHPSCLAWDPKLKLLALGTRTGVVRIYGSPGAEFEAKHKDECSVMALFFISGQGRLISQCDDSTLHLFEMNEKDGKWVIEEVKSCALEGGLKKVTTCCLQSSGEHLLIGTDGGNIYLLDVKTFELTDQIIYQDIVMQNVPDDYKLNPGSVEAIAEHPLISHKILIGYNRGLMVLWDNQTLNSENTYISSQQLESVCWHRSGTKFVSSHNDGSYVVWSSTDSSKPEEAANTPYGPYPCKAITKVLRRSVKGGDMYTIFSGGMPRACYGDKYTISVMCGSDKHKVFDFTSKVLDFLTISHYEDDYEYENPHSLVVLAEEELVVIDLECENWLEYRLPYLNSLHSSAITCSQHVNDVPQDVWNKIVAAGNHQVAGKYSDRDWPIIGGEPILEEKPGHHLLLTGHEDGGVRFWDASGISLSLLYTLTTSNMFVNEDGEPSVVEDASEDWPPLRKVGSFDPYSEDPRLAVKKILLCVYTQTLVVAGTAGQIVLFDLKEEEIEKGVESVPMNIVSDRDSFIWKGHNQLVLKDGNLKYGPGFQPNIVAQLSPPAAITAIAMQSDWGLIAAGTAHGFGLLDFVQKKSVITKCTLNPNDLLATGDAAMTRRKSFKKSLRESFRRLRKGRSQRGKRDKTPTRSEEGKGAAKESKTEIEAPPASDATPTQETKPIERQIEARPVDDSTGSMVRCLYLDQSFIINNSMTTSTLWAGTNAGAIFVYTISRPQKENRDKDAVACQLGKEIQLKHRAPVIAIRILDGSGRPLPEPFEVQNEKAKSPDLSGSHRVLICSEEQFKVFTLPSLKPYCKFKLTAHEGARVRKVGILNFRNKSEEKHIESCLACLTNQGDISIFSIPDLRKQLTYSCLKREDINGISSAVFTRDAQGFYLQSPCEFRRFTLSAHSKTDTQFKVELPEGARPIPVVVEEVTVEAKDAEEKKPEEPAKETETEKAETETKEPVATTETKIEEPAQVETKAEDSLNVSENKNDVNMSQDEDKKDLDITVDSVKDHLASLTIEDAKSTTITTTTVAENATCISTSTVETTSEVVTSVDCSTATATETVTNSTE